MYTLIDTTLRKLYLFTNRLHTVYKTKQKYNIVLLNIVRHWGVNICIFLCYLYEIPFLNGTNFKISKYNIAVKKKIHVCTLLNAYKYILQEQIQKEKFYIYKYITSLSKIFV